MTRVQTFQGHLRFTRKGMRPSQAKMQEPGNGQPRRRDRWGRPMEVIRVWGFRALGFKGLGF